VSQTLRDQVVKKLFTENVRLRRDGTSDHSKTISNLSKSVETLKKDNDILKLCAKKQSNIIVRLKKENIIEKQISQECVVCFESLYWPGAIKILECGHVFHDECIRILDKCPMDWIAISIDLL
jgi:hypothetical protein